MSANDRASFEHFEEQCIFDCYQHYFFYQKHSHEHRTSYRVHSFRDAIEIGCSKGCRQNELIKHLCQMPNDSTTPEAIRLIAINVGENLVSLRFSAKLTDRLVEIFAPHLSSIKHLQFDETNIGSDSIRAVAKFCGTTLRTLRVRGCPITSESCGWMAGAIGHNTPRLRKLQALDVASTKVDDRGLSFLQGLPRLKYLDLSHCVRLTDRGVGNIISKGSLSHMNILNMRGCSNIGDYAVENICQVMTGLVHLNLSQCGSITNRSAKYIGLLAQLETLSVEGATAINDVGLGMIYNRPKLILLNITGCSISRKSLMAVIESMDYVCESSHFFGFLIRSSDAKVSVLREQALECLHREKNQAVHRLQGVWKEKRNTMHEIRISQEHKHNRAASIIQLQLLNCMSRKKFSKLWHIGCARKLSLTLQPQVRGWLARRKLREIIAQYRIESQYAIFVQKIYRGNYVRSHDNIVMPAVLFLRAKRLHENRSAAAIKIQCLFRQTLAMILRCYLQNDLNTRINSSVIIQKYTRRMLARIRRFRYELFAEMLCSYTIKMSLRIQCFVRQYFARKELRCCLFLALSRQITQHNAARIIQSRVRGCISRCHTNDIYSMRNEATINIQKVWRGCLVKHWRDIRWCNVKEDIRQRAAWEIEDARRRHNISSSSGGAQTFSQGYGISIANNDDNHSNVNDISNSSSDELLIYAFGESYIGLRCLIYWDDGLYRSSTINGYDERMRLWQIDYDEDDSEYLDLVRDKSRVMVNNGHDFVPFTHYRTPQLEAYLIQRNAHRSSMMQRDTDQSNLSQPKHGQEQNSKPSTPQFSNDSHYSVKSNNMYSELDQENKGQCDLWMSAYVARGLLDQVYAERTIESLDKLRNSHVVKALATSIGSMTKRNNNVDLIHFTQLLNEVENALKFGAL